MRQSLIARNERDLAGLDLCDTPPNFGSLRCCDVSGNVVGQTLQNTVGEFRPLRSGKLLCLFENEGAQCDGADEGNCSRKLQLPTLLSITERLQSAPLMKTLIEEFKSFILKGNVVTLAVGVIIGVAFGKIVDSVVKDIITPLIGMVGGSPDFSGLHIKSIMIGNFINAAISFLILAAVVFFLIVKPYNLLMAKFEKKEEAKPAGPPPATLDDVIAELKALRQTVADSAKK